MKVRKLAVALALAGGLGSSVAQALGLGEIELQSYLNEPLDAEIALPQSSGVDPGDLFVNVAPESAYERVGLDRNQFLSKLKFEVVTRSDGSLVVNVSSREPLREPYLNFLLELTWPSGRLMREYSVLVDPPVYAEESGVREPVSAPAAPATTATQPSTRSAESVRRQAQAEQSLSRGVQTRTLGPTGSSDTLWTIASRVRPNNSVSMQQVMLALQDLNPGAFIGGNINRLKRGEVLRVPTLEQIQSRSRAEATQLVSEQNREFQAPKRTVDATASQPKQAEPAAPTSSGDELKLLVGDDDARETEEGGSAGGDSQVAGGVDAGSAVAMEELESTRRENEELNTRVDDLQAQVETLQRLIELKNSQLADLQQMAGESSEQPMAGTSEASAEPAASDAGAVAEGAADAGGPQEQTAGAEAAVADSVEAESEAAAIEDSQPESGETETAPVTDEPAVTGEPEAADTTVAEPDQAAQPEAEPAVAEKAFPGNVIDAITNNTLYQLALGGGLVLLLLLLLALARRNANREKAFYEQLNSDSEEGSDSLDLSLDEEAAVESSQADAINEADNYLAFGRHDQAAQALEIAISKEPSRTDLRLKLLAVYADIQDRESFDKQYGEIQALNDEESLAAANDLRAQLEEAESMPSIDDLESQLRSDSFGSDSDSAEADTDEAADSDDMQLSDELLADQYDAGKEGEVENEFGEFDSVFADFDLNEAEQAEEDALAPVKTDADQETAETGDNDSIEFDLSDLELELSEEPAEEVSDKRPSDQDSDSEDMLDFGLDSDLDDGAMAAFESKDDKQEQDSDSLDDGSDDFSLDLESSLTDEDKVETDEPVAEPDLEVSAGDAGTETSGQEASGPESSGDLDSLDESFLDELDAELDKVASEDDDLGRGDLDESSLDDLELDVSDDDLALMEEFSDTADSASHAEAEKPSLDEELSLEDTLGEGDVLGETEASSPEEEVAGTETLEELDALGDLDDSLASDTDDEGAESDLDVPVASEAVGDGAAARQPVDIEESELGDEDDFDFLAGTDEAATKLDLARAYIEMGDSDGARDILEEVSVEGDEDQQVEAKELLKNLS